jgi:membrane protein implicated in regulation of membrane protease activity
MMATHNQSPARSGDLGIVELKICPYRPGQVKYQGTWWTAHCLTEVIIPAGTIVRIVRIEGLRAIVEPLATPQP